MTNKIYTLIILLSFFTAPAISQTILSGKITTTKNLPVSNGSISILNSNINSISDSNGLFKIKLPAAGNYQLEINQTQKEWEENDAAAAHPPGSSYDVTFH